MKNRLHKFIGTKDFYKKVLKLMIPIFIQNGITNFVNLLDNIMIGQMGQSEMTGVSVANSLLFIFNLMVFGIVAAGGIFGAQFVGSKDREGVRDTMRFKLVASLLLTVIIVLVLVFFKTPLIDLFLKGEGAVEDAAACRQNGEIYVTIMLAGLPFFALTQSYSSTLRENNETVMPMISGIAAILINLFFNWCLIFGNLGFPALGVIGGAIATVMSRIVEFLILAIFAKVKQDRFSFIRDLYHHFRIPLSLIRKILTRGSHLVVNEAMWSIGMVLCNQCYSLRALNVVAAQNINSSCFNLLSVAFMSVGVTASIILGQELGSDQLDKAYDTGRKLIFLSFAIGIGTSILLAATSGIIPLLYNVENDTRDLARSLLLISALIMPLDAITHCSYFVLRSGGKVLVTLIFDSGFQWAVYLPLAYILIHYTNLPIVPLYLIVQSATLIKATLGIILVRKKSWLCNMVAKA